MILSCKGRHLNMLVTASICIYSGIKAIFIKNVPKGTLWMFFPVILITERHIHLSKSVCQRWGPIDTFLFFSFYFTDSHQAGSPVVVFGLLPHEQKMSVINLVLRKSHDLCRPIKSKDKLIFHIGCRRFTANPIFSQHTNGNKHKVSWIIFLELSVQ